MIPDLSAGDGDFSGPKGYDAYFNALEPHQKAYRPVNEQLRRDWEANKSRLFRLRDAAESHLWPRLHNEWLPALLAGDEKSAARFPDLIATALEQRPIARFLDMAAPTVWVVGGFAATSWATLIAMAANVPLQASVTVGYVAGEVAKAAIKEIWEREAQGEVAQLARFYQRALDDRMSPPAK